MKTYQLSFARSLGYIHPKPECTAYKVLPGIGGDKLYKVWSNRAAMLKTIEMQKKRAPKANDWIPLIKEK